MCGEDHRPVRLGIRVGRGLEFRRGVQILHDMLFLTTKSLQEVDINGQM